MRHQTRSPSELWMNGHQFTDSVQLELVQSDIGLAQRIEYGFQTAQSVNNRQRVLIETSAVFLIRCTCAP